jgi:putative intracellular protease/amidase
VAGGLLVVGAQPPVLQVHRSGKHDPTFLKLLENTRPVDEIDLDRFDAIVVAGGQGPMFTFEAAKNLHEKFAAFFL